MTFLEKLLSYYNLSEQDYLYLTRPLDYSSLEDPFKFKGMKEAIDIVKKHLAQGHELDKEKLIKELGDIAWYLAETAYALDVSLEEVLSLNIEKLKKRYPEGFDSEKSINRNE